jgi:shikimate kinase
MCDIQGRNVYLIGMMGSGKTTVGKLLAEKLKCDFTDTDLEIEAKQGQTVAKIFQTNDGEAKFRQLETEVLTEVSVRQRQVIATGGGIVTQADNWKYLQQGLTVWLNPSIEILIDRLQHETRTRPILNTSGDLATKLQEIISTRRDLYARAKIHILISSPLSPAEIADITSHQLSCLTSKD